MPPPSVSQTVSQIKTKRQRTTPEEATHECRICGKSFKRSYNWKAHMETHNPDRKYPHPCTATVGDTSCTKKFQRKTDLDRHYDRVHLKHKCDLCGDRFAFQDTLRRHTENGCPKRFGIGMSSVAATASNQRSSGIPETNPYTSESLSPDTPEFAEEASRQRRPETGHATEQDTLSHEEAHAINMQIHGPPPSELIRPPDLHAALFSPYYTEQRAAMPPQPAPQPAASSNNATVHQFILRNLQQEPRLQGWQSAIEIQYRGNIIFQIFSQLRLLQSQLDLHYQLQLALRFETKAFADASDRQSAYEHMCKKKLEDIHELRTKQSAGMHSGDNEDYKRHMKVHFPNLTSLD
ncbi:MAG: hypothetical protein Q9226_009257 [Calogaya cf. arnoldii]